MMVNVDGWSNPRRVIEQAGIVLFEVAKDHNHCPTCAERIRHVERVLAARNLACRWKNGDGSRVFVELDAPAPGKDVRQHIGELLDLIVQ